MVLWYHNAIKLQGKELKSEGQIVQKTINMFNKYRNHKTARKHIKCICLKRQNNSSRSATIIQTWMGKGIFGKFIMLDDIRVLPELSQRKFQADQYNLNF